MMLVDSKKYVKGSQSGILYKYICQCNVLFIIGLVFLVLLLMSNHFMSKYTKEQMTVEHYLNQFRNASRSLTISVTNYVATGDESVKDAYFEELDDKKNREDAIEHLSKAGLLDDELEDLQGIVEMSNSLIPNEMMAIELTQKGDFSNAKSMVFSFFYKNAINNITESIDLLIDKVVNRAERIVRIIRMVQLFLEIGFSIVLFILMMIIVKTIRFARTEILHPVMKVSEQLLKISEGDLHQKLDLNEDESEVGKLASSIRLMKSNWSDMIYEIAYSLEEMGKGNYALEFATEYVGEFVTIKESLHEIVEGMREIIVTISEASKDMDGGALQLSKAAESLAEACSTQAMEVSNVLLYLQGISEMIRANERDAEEAVKISNLARSTVDLEEERINRLCDTLNDVGHCIEEMSTVLEMTSMSEETQTLIDNTMKSLCDTLESTNHAMTELEDMKLGAEETTQRIERIVKNFGEEINNIDMIEDNLTKLANAVDNNSATAEETAAISTQQKSNAANLVALVDNFKI